MMATVAAQKAARASVEAATAAATAAAAATECVSKPLPQCADRKESTHAIDRPRVCSSAETLDVKPRPTAAESQVPRTSTSPTDKPEVPQIVRVRRCGNCNSQEDFGQYCRQCGHRLKVQLQWLDASSKLLERVEQDTKDEPRQDDIPTPHSFPRPGHHRADSGDKIGGLPKQGFGGNVPVRKRR